MDCGKDVRRKGAAGLAKIANKGFVEGWLLDNQERFVETMELIREGAPVQWARLYVDLHKLGISREANINININRQQDRERLQALITTRIDTLPQDYTQFEEVPLERKEIPIIKREVIEEDF